MKLIFRILLLSFLLFTSCAGSIQKGTCDSNPRLIFYSSGIHKFTLKNNYGMMIFYSKYNRFSKPRFEFYDQKTMSIFKTTDRNEFLNKVRTISYNEILDMYDTCTKSTYDKFEEQEIFFTELNSICRAKNIQLILPWTDKDNNVLCTCVNKGP